MSDQAPLAPAMSFYDVLDVPRQAPAEEIRRAYEIALQAYGEGSLAIESLMSDRERRDHLRLIEQAFQILSDPDRRRDYDRWLGESGGEGSYNVVPLPSEPPSRPPDPEPAPAEKMDAASILRAAARVDGPLLKGIRQGLGVSLKDIADVTKIGIMYLKFIEEDTYDGLPAPVYLRGFLRQYARLLRLDEKSVVDGYMRTYNESKEKLGRGNGSHGSD